MAIGILCATPAHAQETRIPVSPFDLREGGEIVLEAERIDAQEVPPVVRASGNVQAEYQGIRLRAEVLEFNQATQVGQASGSVRIDYDIYHLEADALRFDLDKRTLLAEDLRVLVEEQGWFGAERLEASEELVVFHGARLSPCLNQRPGYYFVGERVEWKPKQRSWNLFGRDLGVVIGGVPIMRLPLFLATVGEAARERREVGIPRDIDVQAGFLPVQGAFVEGRTRYALAPGWLGSIPLRVMSGRGVALGLEQNLQAWETDGRLDISFLRQWELGTPEAEGREGLHANLSFADEWMPGGRWVANLGYRVDVGQRFDIQFNPDPSGFPIHRLPEVVVNVPVQQWGGFSLSPMLRTGYLIEERGGAQSPIGQVSVNIGGPSLGTFGLGEIGTYGLFNSTAYRESRSQTILLGGVAGTQRWLPWFETRFSAETQPVLYTGGGSPFVHDVALGTDRVAGGATIHLLGAWSIGATVQYSRPHQPDASFVLGDLIYSLNYQVPCFGWTFAYRPDPFNQFVLDYRITTF